MTPRQPDTDPPRDLDAEALDWFVRCGTLREPPVELQRWLQADPRHRQAYARWSAPWQALDDLPMTAVQHLRQQLAVDKQAQARTVPPSPSRWQRLRTLSRLPAPALGMLLVAAAGYLAWAQWHDAAPEFSARYATARGEQRDITLPDGSHLSLGTATQVQVALYADRREVRIEQGQAFFQVQSNPARPFDVLTGPVTITVVGTRFAVRHTDDVPDNDGVRVAVEEGRVRVAPAQAWRALFGHAVYLNRGQQLNVAANTAFTLPTPVAVAPTSIATWRDGMVSFVDTPLRQALAEFERYGPTGLRLRDPAVGALRLTGTFDPRNLDNFKRILPRVLPVQLVAQAGVQDIIATP